MKLKISGIARLCVLCVCVLMLYGCGGAGSEPAVLPDSGAPRAILEADQYVVVLERDKDADSAPEQPKAPETLSVAPSWQPLAARLVGDGVEIRRVNALFASLGPELSQLPMGTKVKELYGAKYLRRARTPGSPTPAPGLYKGVVTEKNAATCRDFLSSHAAVFARAEAEYGVPKNVAAALLFVETRLGDQVGTHQAVRNLASMAGSDTPERVPDYIAKLPDVDKERLAWLAGRIREKADWAYRELKALLYYAEALGRNPLDIPGSVYGAVGLCQFMPTNIPTLAKDGNGDGVVDLHTVDDAVMSLTHYLARNGWKKQGMTEALRRKALLRYNNSNTYVNTILALAKQIGPEKH